MHTEAKVGIAVILGAALLVLILGRVQRWTTDDQEGTRIVSSFDNVAGLETKSPVQVAGVKVGEVEDISLDGGRAKVRIMLYPGVSIYRGSKAAVRSTGLLGEKYLELMGGDPAQGTLIEGEQVEQYATSGDMDRLINSITKVAEDVGAVAESFKDALGTPEGRDKVQGLVDAVHDFAVALNERGPRLMTRLDSILARIENGSGTIGKLINDPGAYNELEATLADLKDVMARVKAGEGTLGRMIADDALYAKLEGAAEGVRELTDKATNGEGTIGRLMNDDSTIDSINNAMKSIAQLGGKANAMRTYVSFDNEFQTASSESKGYFGLRLDPGGKRDYVLQVITDPAGRTKWGSSSASTPPGSPPTTTELVTTDRKYMISALFSQEFGPLEVHGGLMESSAGGGLRLEAPGPIQLMVDAWDFDSVRPNHDSPHLKAGARIEFGKHIYVHGGLDNFLNSSWDTPFVGAGLTFEDEDLKYLLGSVPLK
ncbi:MAG: MlaD family protein [Nitrospirota bacterium]|nr:MlaD family protein [Nitrospirota bacterium]